jgi:hypothetical protein
MAQEIKGGVCAAFRQSERGVEVVSKYGDLVHSTEFLDLVVCDGTIVDLWLDDGFFEWGLFPYLCFLT